MNTNFINNNTKAVETNINADKPETARFNLDHEINDGFDEWETAQLKRIQEALEQALREYVEQNCKGRGDQAKLASCLHPIISSESHLSKILAFSGADKRHITLVRLAALQYAGVLDFKNVVDRLMSGDLLPPSGNDNERSV